MKRRRSIPVSAIEKTVREYSRTPGKKSWGEWPREVECRVNGKLVGARWYDEKDRLIAERPSRNGKLHGMLLEWDDDGYLTHVAPYVLGRMEGTAKQYHRGRLVGTYTIENGTGLDVWRNWREDRSWYVSEIWPVRGGAADGFECWFNEDERTVWREAHWRNGELHGIEREWKGKQRFYPGFPKFWINGKRVTKRAYMVACKCDSTLTPFREIDDKPGRSLKAMLAQHRHPRKRRKQTSDASRVFKLTPPVARELKRRVAAFRDRKSKGESTGLTWAQAKRRIKSKAKSAV